jgi:hypothetical protein
MRQPKIHPDAFVGLVDALLTIAVTLCNAGLLSRASLAVAFDETHRQQREGGVRTPAGPPCARSANFSNCRSAAIATSRSSMAAAPTM